VGGPNNDILVEAERQLKSYFDGTLKVFSVPLDFVGTEFQTSVWKALLKFHSDRPEPTLRSPSRSDVRRPRVPWAAPAARIQSQSWRPATVSSAQTAI
jgi:hypothetical protein